MKSTGYELHHTYEDARFSRARGVLVFFVIIASLRAGLVSAALTYVAPEWKAHFRAKLVVESCVFQETSFSWQKTRMYHARYEEHAFLFREISRPEDAGLDHITGGDLYAGRFGKNYWAIEGGRVLKLFPDAENMIREYRNPEVSLIEAPRRKLIGALFYGFYVVDPSSVDWFDDFAFKASSFRDDKFRGEVREATGGLPTVIEWRAEADPELRFTTEYKYLRKFDLAYYPSEILVQANVKGKSIPVTEYRILSLTTSHAPLAESWFDSGRYFSAPTSSVPQVLMLTNDQLYVKNAVGNWQKVIAGPLPDLSGKVRNHKHSRAIIIGFVVLSVIPLFFAWRHAKRKRTQ